MQKASLLVKDNDLYLFTSADKVIKRLTSDKAPEVNTRFSADGTENRLYKKQGFVCI